MIPVWLEAWERRLPPTIADDEAAMRLAVEAARLNVARGTGGPFGAILVDAVSRRVLAAGVNLVVAAGSSVLHAEMVAIMRAQHRGGHHHVGGATARSVTLYSSAEPCAMCMGAVPWSGLDRLVCGATDADVRDIGFDEGDKPAGWEAAFARRGIRVTTRVLREEAMAVLAAYRDAGGDRY